MSRADLINIDDIIVVVCSDEHTVTGQVVYVPSAFNRDECWVIKTKDDEVAYMYEYERVVKLNILDAIEWHEERRGID